MVELVVGRAVFNSDHDGKNAAKRAMEAFEVIKEMGMSESAKEKLQSFVERIEKLEEDKRNLGSDITDIYNIAKSDGYDVKALRAVIRLRRKEKAERDDELNAIDTYLHALGMV